MGEKRHHIKEVVIYSVMLTRRGYREDSPEQICEVWDWGRAVQTKPRYAGKKEKRDQTSKWEK